MFWLSDDEEIMTLAFVISKQYRSVTDGWTGGQTDIPPLAIPPVCIASYAIALVKTYCSVWEFPGLHVPLVPLPYAPTSIPVAAF